MADSVSAAYLCTATSYSSHLRSCFPGMDKFCRSQAVCAEESTKPEDVSMTPAFRGEACSAAQTESCRGLPLLFARSHVPSLRKSGPNASPNDRLSSPRWAAGREMTMTNYDVSTSEIVSGSYPSHLAQDGFSTSCAGAMT